jgi:hypothetical protein
MFDVMSNVGYTSLPGPGDRREWGNRSGSKQLTLYRTFGILPVARRVSG